jgi:hypothetical protein
VLLDAVGRRLPQDKRAAYSRLLSTWTTRNIERFDASMHVLAEHLSRAVDDFEPVAPVAASTAEKLMHSIGIKRDRLDRTRERSMQSLAERQDASIRSVTDRLIQLHGLQGEATDTVLERMRTHFAIQERVDETRAALWGSVVTGALAGLKADVVSGGMTLGAGMLVGGVLGGLGGAGIARGMNRLAGADQPEARWSADFLDALVRSSVLRYLAIAHFGRGRGKYVEGEAPPFWRDEVEKQFKENEAEFRAIWNFTREEKNSDTQTAQLQRLLSRVTVSVLERLYPATVPTELRLRA